MFDDIINAILKAITSLVDRFILAFSNIYGDYFTDDTKIYASGYDFIIFLVTVIFILYFFKSGFSSLFGAATKSRKEHNKHDRIVDHIAHMGDEDDDEANKY